ncbi:MAG TPA: serine/threonine-protein kinase [Pseudonocardia sp.]|jgi:serine/threonine protein kinase|nr:serine/threonine-protein kinase [Pseudonocardia sp.]
MTTESDNPPGYELVRRIGSGATSVVWEAAQLSTGRRVALKMLDIDVTDPAALRRFERERKVMSSLATHPGIVTIYDAGVHRHKPWLAMEYCRRGSLAEYVAEHGPLEPVAALAVLQRCAAALGAAHARDIVHCDVKPQNIMLTDHGEPAIGDFGIARVAVGSATTTSVGGFTLDHAAPELLDGSKSSPASDVYALGTTIWEFLAGRPPFREDREVAMAAIMMRILTQPVPDPPEGTPAGLAALLRSMTAKQPGERPADMTAVAASAAGIRAALAPVDPLGAPPFPAAPAEPDPDVVLERADTVRVTRGEATAWLPPPSHPSSPPPSPAAARSPSPPSSLPPAPVSAQSPPPTQWSSSPSPWSSSPSRSQPPSPLSGLPTEPPPDLGDAWAPRGGGRHEEVAPGDETRVRPVPQAFLGPRPAAPAPPPAPPRTSRRAPLIAALVAVALLVVTSGAIVGYRVLNQSTDSPQAPPSATLTPTPTPTPSPTPSRRPSATVTPSASARLDTAGRALAARITDGHVDVSSCRPWSYAPGPGLVAAITCNSGELSNRVGFLQFDTDADMTRFITTTKNTIAADRFGRCDKGLGQSNPWTYRGQTKGDLACVRTGTPLVTKVWWSSFGTGVVASAQDTDAAKAWNWFIANSLIVT